MKGLIQLIGIFGAAACLTGGVALLRRTRGERGWLRALPWLYIACGLIIIAVLVAAKKAGSL